MGILGSLRLRRRPAGPPPIADPDKPAMGHELKYWRVRGLEKGTYIYENYLRLFDYAPGDLAGKVVCDFGSGPFGGLLSVLPDVAEGYPADVLADEYNEMDVSPMPIRKVVDDAADVPDASCDVCFCTNALDHDPRPRDVVADIARILKPGGIFCLHVHHRRADQLNKAHRYVVTEETVRSWLGEEFEELSLEVDADWPNDEPDLTMMYGRFRRRDR